MWRALAAIGLCGIWPGGTPTPTTSDLHIATLRVFRTGHVAVAARINGAGPFELVLDTGSPVTVIGHDAARRAGIGDGAPAPTGGALAMIDLGFERAKTVDVAGARVEALPVMVIDHPVVEMISAFDSHVDGILGFSFFAQFRTTIDYQAGRLSLAPSTYRPADTVQNVLRLITGGDSARPVVAPAGLWGLAVQADAGGDGVRAVTVYAGGPADGAGIRQGDTITEVDGRWITGLADLYAAAAGARPGEDIAVKVVRNGHTITLRMRPRVGL